MQKPNEQKTLKEERKQAEKVFNKTKENRLNLRCHREHMFVRPATTRPIKVS